MTEPVYLSRVRLKKDASAAALHCSLRRLQSNDEGQVQHAEHRIVWSLFADKADRRRDFLWRSNQRGEFLILSARKPEDRHGLFEIDEPKTFAPVLAAGTRLRFSLRANPVIRRRIGARQGHAAKHDVVMDALRTLPKAERAGKRLTVVREQGLAWLERQSAKAGFEIKTEEVGVDGYQHYRVRRKKSAQMGFSTLDFEGILTVTDPAALLTAIRSGLGSAKAFGCGLMLIRRA